MVHNLVIGINLRVGMKYKRKVQEVEAILFDGSEESRKAISKLVDQELTLDVFDDYIVMQYIRPNGVTLFIVKGSYMVKQPDGVIYARHKEEFEKFYEKVE